MKIHDMNSSNENEKRIWYVIETAPFMNKIMPVDTKAYTANGATKKIMKNCGSNCYHLQVGSPE
jgi:hypothetical protein